MTQLNRYTRWTRDEGSQALVADILGSDTNVVAHPNGGTVSCRVPERPLSPDEARMIGVRLIEAASLADAHRAIRDNHK